MIIKRTSNGGVEIQTPAKVNLYLEVLGKRPDGYHEIESLIEPVTFYDRMVMSPAAGEPVIECGAPDVPLDGRNTIARAWKALKKRKPDLGGMKVHLYKSIPSGAGLGGGSSNAAGALLGLNEMYALGLKARELADVGAEVGSDVPFFFAGGRAVVSGRGEVFERLTECTILYYVIILTGINCPTENVYKNLNPALTGNKRHDILLMVRNWDETRSALFNRLEESAFRLFPQLATLKGALVALHPDGVLMSGSGSSIFCVCRTFEGAAKLKSEIEAAGLARCVTAGSSAY